DLASVRACVDAAFGPYVAAIGKPPAPMLADYGALIAEGQVHLLEADQAIAGLIVLEQKPDHLFVDVLAVRPELQRHGIGRALMGFAEASALERSITEVRLYTHVLMTQALAFYARLGYRETARLMEDGYARIYLSRTLSAG
ncbi:MAG: GNAT family N-acetyltransferase, partial [Geminicoccales bacterium]